jgi:hypothetical protein
MVYAQARKNLNATLTAIGSISYSQFGSYPIVL